MSSSPSSPQRIVLRGTSGYWFCGIAALIMIVLLADAALRGAWDVVTTALPWMVLIVWAMYLVLVRPAVIVEPELLRVRNIFRDHDIAWKSITDFGTRFQLTIFLEGGRKIAAWGGPKITVGRPKLGSKGHEPAPLADDVIRDARLMVGPGRSADRSATRSTWDLITIAVTAVVVLACLATLVF